METALNSKFKGKKKCKPPAHLLRMKQIDLSQYYTRRQNCHQSPISSEARWQRGFAQTPLHGLRLFERDQRWARSGGSRRMINPTKPIGSMYGIFTYIWLIFMVNVAKYTIHGSYGKNIQVFLSDQNISKPQPPLKLRWSWKWGSLHPKNHSWFMLSSNGANVKNPNRNILQMLWKCMYLNLPIHLHP